MRIWRCQTCGFKSNVDPTITGCPSCRQFKFVEAEEIDTTGNIDTTRARESGDPEAEDEDADPEDADPDDNRASWSRIERELKRAPAPAARRAVRRPRKKRA